MLRVPLWLERATPGDPPALAALEARCQTHPWTERQFREEVGHGPPEAVLVLRSPVPAVAPWRGVAAFCIYRMVLDEMHILNLAVAPPVRRRGIGRWLLAFALEKAARSGAARALLEVRDGNAGARTLYGGMGFQGLARRRGYYRDPVEDAVVLVREPLC